MCNKNNYNEVMQAIAEYRMLKKQAEEELKRLEGELKDYMTIEGLEVLTGLEHTASLKSVTSNRLDTKLLKVDLPEVYDKYTRQQTTTRFNFS